MVITFTVCTLLCFFYWTVLAVYAGPFSSQNYIWLIFSAFFAANVAAARVYREDPKKIPLWLITALHTLCVVGILIFMITGILIVSKMHTVPEENLDYIVVLGAKVQPDGSPSKSLKRRLDTAIAYADLNPRALFVLSGGKAADEPIPESRAMADYLFYNGIPQDRLLLEIQSGNTYENILFSEALIDRITEKRRGKLPEVRPFDDPDGQILQAEERPIRVGIITGDFHVFRTMTIAKHLGLQNTYGIAAKSDPVTFIHLCFRECLAILKDKFLGHM